MSVIKVIFQNKLGLCRRFYSFMHRDVLFFSQKYSVTSFKIENHIIFSKNAKVESFTSSDFFVSSQRNYSKKKKSSKKSLEVEEESESDEDEVYENLGSEEFADGSTTFIKSVPSMRIDTIAKAAFGTSKKKIEKDFYSSNMRLNGQKVLKKSFQVTEGDEVDLIKDFSVENSKLLQIDRVIVKSIGKVSGAGNYRVTLQVFKGLTIDNYPEPWLKSSV